MNKISDIPCIKCGGNTRVRFINEENDGYYSRRAGLRRECLRCGYKEFIASLDEENKQEANLSN